ncbi:hypothetical protein KO481_08285 [Nocardia sp. NEAU-G5]|uniref:Uncharacterized protein n=1 Tax=Nocardia albiluteola TaxID=2842303 RepID=A0ABS6AU25_9NOCA|nr:hypothetical protein [Nocardia albiluteola]MBU3061521.1 hypothetical protein [Nocardia albiluteola]
MKRKIIGLTAAAASLLLLTGCGSTVPGTPTAGEIDVRHLAVGRYPVVPLDATTSYDHYYDKGKSLAAIRLAGHVALGLDIDPRLKFGAGADGLTHDYDMNDALSDAGAAAAVRDKVLFGFTSGSTDIEPPGAVYTLPNATLLTLTVMQFAGDDDAAHAAADIESTDFGSAPDRNRPESLDKYPAAHSHSQQGTPVLESTIAHGHYAVSAVVQIPGGDVGTMKALTEKAFDKQAALLDTLPPLSPVEIIKQDMDTNGMLRRLLNTDGRWYADPRYLASYDLRGFLHFQMEQESAKALYTSLGINEFGVSDSYHRTLGDYIPQGLGHLFQSGVDRNDHGDVLYRSASTERAREVWSKILNAPDSNMSPAGVPDTKCTQLPSRYNVKNFTCAVRYRQYVALVWSPQIDDAHQRAAAQYALLANSQGM